MDRREFEHIVIGLGAIGSAACYWLARRAGSGVLGLEQFELGHERGASEDHSRILRLSYHSKAYVDLARQAYDAWRAVEAESGEALMVRTGGLDLGPRESAIPMDDYTRSMDAAGVPYERLDADEIMRRWPQFKLGDDIHGIFQADSGLLPASRCNDTHRRLAAEHGATLRGEARVSTIRPVTDGVEVVSGGKTFHATTLTIAADAWTNDLLEMLGQRKLALQITQEQVTYFASPSVADYAPDRFPVWIWLDDPCFYGLPTYGTDATKVAQDVGGREVTAETRTFETDERTLGRVTRFMERHLPTAIGPLVATKTCLYTLTPDRDFVIDTLPGHPNIAVALGAGHAFKFASLFGRILSQLAVDGASTSDISGFRYDRPILGLDDPPRNYMV